VESKAGEERMEKSNFFPGFEGRHKNDWKKLTGRRGIG